MRGKLRLCTRFAFRVIDFDPETKQLEKYENMKTPTTRNTM